MHPISQVHCEHRLRLSECVCDGHVRAQKLSDSMWAQGVRGVTEDAGGAGLQQVRISTRQGAHASVSANRQSVPCGARSSEKAPGRWGVVRP